MTEKGSFATFMWRNNFPDLSEGRGTSSELYENQYTGIGWESFVV
jgi:hypothetical protein